MNAATLLQAAFFAAAFRFLQFAYNSVGQRKVTLCRLIDHKYVSFPSPPLFGNCIWYLAGKFPHAFTAYIHISLTEIMLPQMCELLMSF